MSKLKTLKELHIINAAVGYEDEGSEWVNLKKLKAEAVKWAKQLRKDPEDLFDYGTSIDEFIKHFFNLTEEDLG